MFGEVSLLVILHAKQFSIFLKTKTMETYMLFSERQSICQFDHHGSDKYVKISSQHAKPINYTIKLNHSILDIADREIQIMVLYWNCKLLLYLLAIVFVTLLQIN